MRKFLYLELQRLRHNVSLYVVLFIGAFITVSQFFVRVVPCISHLHDYETFPSIGTATPIVWYIKWIGGEMTSPQSFLYFLLLPLLAAVPLGASLYLDRKRKYTVNLYVREEKKYYYRAKTVVTFLCGAFVAVIPLLLNMFLSMSVLPSLLPEAISGMAPISAGGIWAELFYSEPDLYLFLYMIIIFLYGGITATFTLALGTVVDNMFVCIIAPFAIHVFLYAFSTSGVAVGYSPFMYLSPAQRGWPDIRLEIIIVEYAVILLLSLGILLIARKRDETL